MAWLRLIRWQNLLIILLTQFIAWRCIVVPESPQVLGLPQFVCLSLSTVLIAAAGYIINDYFDIRIDSINKPGRVLLETVIPRKFAIISHSLLNITAMALAGYVAVGAQHPEWLLLQLGCTVLLWFYSTHLKRQYVTGNIAVSLLTALTIIALFIYEPVLQHEAQMPLLMRAVSGDNSSLPVWVLAVYAYFAFMLTWIREIVKDMEDIRGDEAEGCLTMPVKRGLQFATRFTLALAVMVVIPLIIASVTLFTRGYLLLPAYLILLLIVPVCIWAFFIGRGATEQHYHRASAGLKWIMVLGICSLLVYDI